MTRAGMLDLAGLGARLGLGATLLVAGLLKVTNLQGSARAVRAFQILPFDLGGYAGYALPVVEIGLGLLLLAGLFTRVAAAGGALLIGAFVAGIASAWARGLSIDCGCFGGGGEIAPERTAYPLELARDGALLACGLWLVARPRSAASVDGTPRPMTDNSGHA